MTEKNSFVYKLFLLLNISDFSLFLCKTGTPPRKTLPPLKIEILSSPPPLFENLVGGSSPPAERGGGVHTMTVH